MMRSRLRLKLGDGIFILILAALFAGCGEDRLSGKTAPKYRFAPIMRTDVIRTVEATGTVQPRNTKNGIPVGAQVNGRIIKLFVDYNSVVTNGQIVALIDPLVYEASYKNAIGSLHANQANVEQREAALTLAEKTFRRKRALFDKRLCSEAEYDIALEAYDAAKALLGAAKASVEQSQAQVAKTKADLDYCTIRSPVNGVVLARKVEEGETVVSSMNAVPVLTIAEDLKVIWIEATVPEADVGNIKVGQEVTFTADAYRRKFKGKVRQIRLASTMTNNVVTYPIIIEAENPDEMLFPGMTATLSIETARSEDCVAVSAAAFRFRPREEDCPEGELPSGRKVWTVGPDGSLEYNVVETGVTDDAFTELLNAAALEGRDAVVGYEIMSTLAQNGDKPENPFLPKPPKRGTKGTAPEPKRK